MPKVLINTGYYEELASKKLSKKDKDYLASRYTSGKWMLKALEQRSATILRVSREIIEQQNLFLDKGLAFIKPMILKDIAKELDLHESTISRITSSKEIDTPRGVYPLKFFFSKAISSDGKDDISSQSVKSKIKDLINNEYVIVKHPKQGSGMISSISYSDGVVEIPERVSHINKGDIFDYYDFDKLFN